MKKPKVLSARVSDEIFLKVKQLAEEKEQDVSEYILDKLFSNEVEPENKRLSTLVFKLQEKLTNAEDKSLRYFNEIERLTSVADALRDKLMASQEQTTYFKIENESLKPRNSNLQVRLDVEEQISAERVQEIRSNKDYIYRIEENLETAKNENTRQKEDIQKLNEDVQALKEKAQQVDGLNDQIKELQTQLISVQQEAYTSAAFYSGALKLYLEGEKKIQIMKEKHNVVIREIVHKLSHEPESFRNKEQFKFVKGEIWE